MIEITNLTKDYNGQIAVDIPQLKIEKSESFGLVGNNGAGKTTLFRLILDLIRPTTGGVLSKEEKVMGSSHWKYYTGSFLDEGFLIDFLTPLEYFKFVGSLQGLEDGDINELINKNKDFLSDDILGGKKYIRDLSQGNKKKVGILASFLADPEVLVLDEPFANLDPSTVSRLINMLNNMKKEKGTTLLISSHDLNHVTEVCERIVILDESKIVHDIKTSDDTLKELENYFAVKEE
ncbi:ABC transporter ATP-binding protein [Bacteroidota bacterium]